jgi:GR25 family glycosyltransferase involved in LPS biosynthesis
VQLGTAPGVTGLSSAILTCAHEDNAILPFTLDLPEYQLLTPAKVACWNSHLSVIRRIAEGDGKTLPTEEQDVSVILEDDVDMEWDIRERLASIWTLLPAGWDVVFLGTLAMDFGHLGLFDLLDLPTLCRIRQQVIAWILESNAKNRLLRALLVE